MSRQLWEKIRSASFSVTEESKFPEEDDVSEKELFNRLNTIDSEDTPQVQSAHFSSSEAVDTLSFYRNMCIGVVYLVLCIFGGLLNSLKTNWLPLIEAPDRISSGIIINLLAESLPLTILVVLLSFNYIPNDRYYIKRIILYLGISLFNWASLYISSSYYYPMGDNFGLTAFCASNGPFDYVIGHICPTYSHFQALIIDLTGMSLTGLSRTVGAGFLIYCYGFGWEYMLSGGLLGLIFVLARPNISAALFIDGTFRWLIVAITFVARRKNPDDSPAVLDVIWIIVFLFDAVLMASTYGYGLVVAPPPINFTTLSLSLSSSTASPSQGRIEVGETAKEMLVGLVVSCGMFILLQLFYIPYLVVVIKYARRSNYLIIPEASEEDYDQSILTVVKWLLTHKQINITHIGSPWKYIIRGLRFIIYAWSMWLLGIFLFLVFYRITENPCNSTWIYGVHNLPVCVK